MWVSHSYWEPYYLDPARQALTHPALSLSAGQGFNNNLAFGISKRREAILMLLYEDAFLLLALRRHMQSQFLMLQ
jgi:hypothetical protein